MKKLLSIMVAVAMVLALAVPALAADETPPAESTPAESTPEETIPEEEVDTEPTLSSHAYNMTYYVGGYGAMPNRYQCNVHYREQGYGYGDWFNISFGDPIVENWPTEVGTYTVTFDKTTKIEGAGDTEYTFDISMNVTVLELPALSGKCGDNMTWSFDKDSYTLTISGTGDMYTITAEADGTYSNAPGWWMLPVKHIVVAEGVETLSKYAFGQADTGYYKLVESIQLPSTLKAIPDAFVFSENLKTLSVPEGITKLGGWIIGNPGSSFGDLDALYLPSTLTKLDVATVILAGISEGSKIEMPPDFPTIYFAGTQEQWDTVELADTIHIVYGDSVMDNTYVDDFIKAIYGKTTAELFAEVTVVCTGKEDLTVENGTATVPDSSVEITEGEDVVIDVTDTEEDVSSVVISSETVDKIADAETAVEIKLPDATVSFDKTAVGSIGKQAGEAAVTIVATEVKDSTLTTEQKAALEEKEVCAILNLEAFAGETKITEFGGGKVTVSVPFELPEGKAGADYYVAYVAYVADDGTITAMPTTYSDGVLRFETTHFSSYIVLENVNTNPPAGDTTGPNGNSPTDNPPSTGDVPQTGDDSYMFLLVIAMLLCVVGMTVCLTKCRTI